MEKEALNMNDSPAKKTIALIAHDGKKTALVSFVDSHRKWFEQFNLVGTGTTGGRIAALGLPWSAWQVVLWVGMRKLQRALRKGLFMR